MITCTICGDTQGPWAIEYIKDRKIFGLVCENCIKKLKKGTKKNGKK